MLWLSNMLKIVYVFIRPPTFSSEWRVRKEKTDKTNPRNRNDWIFKSKGNKDKLL